MRRSFFSGARVYIPAAARAEISRRQSLSAAALFTVPLLLLCLYTRPSAVMAGTPRQLSQSGYGQSADIEVHSVSLSRENGFVSITGEARNVTRKDLPQLEAIVEFFDPLGRLTSIESGLLKTGPIAAGDESPFQVLAPDRSSMASYRLRFRRIAGPLVPSRIEG